MHNPIQIDDARVLIDGHHLLWHDQQLRNIRIVLYALYKIKSEFETKHLEINFPDIEPIKAAGFDHVIKLIVDTIGIPKEKFIINTHCKSFKSDLATINYLPFWVPRYLIGAMSKFDNNTKLNNNAALFGLIFGRFSPCRLKLAHYAATVMPESSYVIFQPKIEYVCAEIGPMENLFDDELSWLRQWKNTNRTLDGNAPGDIAVFNLMMDYQHIWPKFKIEIVAETDVTNMYGLTEKTCRCLWTKKPFFLVGEPGMLKFLNDLGLRTFNGIFDESYDNESNLYRRIEMIQNEMLRLSQMSADNQDKMFEQLRPILEHNHKNYFRFVNNYHKLYES